MRSFYTFEYCRRLWAQIHEWIQTISSDFDGITFELQTQIEISKNLDFLTESEYNELYQDSREIEVIIIFHSFYQVITENAK